MSTLNHEITYTPGVNVYARVWAPHSANVLDFADYTFKAIGSATTPYQALTERSGISTNSSRYTGAIDLASLAANLAVVEGSLIYYQRIGGAPDPAADLEIGGPAGLEAQLGKFGQRRLAALIQIHHRTTGGTPQAVVHVTLTADGEKVDLSSVAATATCALQVDVQGGSSLFSIATGTFGNPTADDRWEATYNNPNWTSDQIHYADVTIVANGNTYVFPHVLMAWA